MNQYDQNAVAPTQFNFSETPLQPLMGLLERKQGQYDKNLGEADALQGLLKADVLQGHVGRVNALNQDLESEIDNLASNYGGDYSQAGRDVMRLKRKIGKMYSPTGEIGQYQALKNKYTTLDKETRGLIGKKGGPSANTYNLWQQKTLGQLNDVKYNNGQLDGNTNVERLQQDPEAIKMLEDYAKEFKANLTSEAGWEVTPDGKYIQTTSGGRKELKEEDVYANLLQRLGSDSRIKDYYTQLHRLGDTTAFQGLNSAAKAIANRTAFREDTRSVSVKESQRSIARMKRAWKLKDDEAEREFNQYLNPVRQTSNSSVASYSPWTGNFTDDRGTLIEGTAPKAPTTVEGIYDEFVGKGQSDASAIIDDVMTSTLMRPLIWTAAQGNKVENWFNFGEDDLRETMEQGRVKDPRLQRIIQEEKANGGEALGARRFNKKVEQRINQEKQNLSTIQRVSFGYSKKDQDKMSANKHRIADSNFSYYDNDGKLQRAKNLHDLAEQNGVDIEDFNKEFAKSKGAVNTGWNPGSEQIAASNEWSFSAIPGVKVFEHGRETGVTQSLTKISALWDPEAAFDGTASSKTISGDIAIRDGGLVRQDNGQPLIPTNSMVRPRYISNPRGGAPRDILEYSIDGQNWTPIKNENGLYPSINTLKNNAIKRK